MAPSDSGNQTAPFEKLAGFQVVRRLGEGGMGEVYLGTDERLNRDVALKVIKLQFRREKEVLNRLGREVRALAAFRHQNIVTVYGLLDDEERGPVIIMEHVEGFTLESIIKEGPLPAICVAIVGARIANALDHVHFRKIVHRDLKPSNVMLTRTGEVKLMDFGVARHLNLSPLTQEGNLQGTPPYMSPEQINGDEIDHRTDIYSLGVMLYEALCGARPFEAKSQPELRRKITNGECRPIHKVAPSAPRALLDIVKRAMDCKPDNRFPDAATMRQALDLFLAHEEAASQQALLLTFLWQREKIKLEEIQQSLKQSELNVLNQYLKRIHHFGPSRGFKPWWKERTVQGLGITAFLIICMLTYLLLRPEIGAAPPLQPRSASRITPGTAPDDSPPFVPQPAKSRVEDGSPLPSIDAGSVSDAGSSSLATDGGTASSLPADAGSPDSGMDDAGATRLAEMHQASMEDGGSSLQRSQVGTPAPYSETPDAGMGNVAAAALVLGIGPPPPAPRTKTVVEEVGTGSIRIRVDPSADVYIDGEYRGRTPRDIRRLSVGGHVVDLANEACGDYSERILVVVEKDRFHAIDRDIGTRCATTPQSPTTSAVSPPPSPLSYVAPAKPNSSLKITPALWVGFERTSVESILGKPGTEETLEDGTSILSYVDGELQGYSKGQFIINPRTQKVRALILFPDSIVRPDAVVQKFGKQCPHPSPCYDLVIGKDSMLFMDYKSHKMKVAVDTSSNAVVYYIYYPEEL